MLKTRFNNAETRFIFYSLEWIVSEYPNYLLGAVIDQIKHYKEQSVDASIHFISIRALSNCYFIEKSSCNRSILFKLLGQVNLSELYWLTP